MLCVVLVSRRRGSSINREEGASTPPALGRAALSQGAPAVCMSIIKSVSLYICVSVSEGLSLCLMVCLCV